MIPENLRREIAAERARHVAAGFTVKRNAEVSPDGWVALVVRELGMAVTDGDPHPANVQARYRRQLVRVIAFGIDALEAFDLRANELPDPLDRYRKMAAKLACERGHPHYLVVNPPLSHTGKPERGPYVVSSVEIGSDELGTPGTERFDPPTGDTP